MLVLTLIPRSSVWYIHGLGMRLASTDLIVGGRKEVLIFVCLFVLFFSVCDLGTRLHRCISTIDNQLRIPPLRAVVILHIGIQYSKLL